MADLLLIEGDPDHRESLARILEHAGFKVTRHDLSENLTKEDLVGIDGVLAEPGILNRMDALHRSASGPLIVIDRTADIRRAVRAMKLGAADYLAAPVRGHELLASVNEALSAYVDDSISGGAKPFPMIGSSDAMRDLKNRIGKSAPTDATVLVAGGLGTGKELGAPG
ncbi:MAG: sigma 54-interacting transcriptional regulator, partial [Gammaproteobacteria bacterium]|nr:sigma 54-interacting transcriptional regulator [Gammaproteobacteria bacterium]